MNGRALAYTALLALAAVTLLALTAAADPADISNPPTHDWFFDSGTTVTISQKVWDVNYNITVANFTHLILDNCTFTVYDPYSLNDMWMYVWWNGSLTIRNCDFRSTGTRGYFIAAENVTVLDRSTFEGLVTGAVPGGISIRQTHLTLNDVTIKDVEGVALWAENCDITATKVTVTGSGGDGNDEAAFMAMYFGNSPGDLFTLSFEDSHFDDNVGRGLGVRSYSNWADLFATFNDCTFSYNDRRGLDFFWGGDWVYESTNSSIDLMVTGCTFKANHHDGFRFNVWSVVRDASSFVNITLDDCDFERGDHTGAFINVRESDSTYNILVTRCDFWDNCIQGSRSGLAISNEYLMGLWNVEVSECTFDDNFDYGLHLVHYSSSVEGGHINVTDCLFANHTQSLYLYHQGYGDHFADIWIEDCSFSGSKDAGVMQEFYRMEETPIDVHFVECDFSSSTGGGIASTSSLDFTDGTWWDVRECTFQDLGGKAIEFMLDTPFGGSTLEVTDSTVDNTAGIQFMSLGSVDYTQPMHVLKMENVTVTNTTAAAIEAMVYGYYSVGLSVDLDTVVVENALFNGIRAMTSSVVASATASIEMDIQLDDVDVSEVGGNGLNLGTDRIDYKGTRTLMVDGLTVDMTQKAITVSGLKGEVRNTQITNSLKQDVVGITSDLELYDIDVESVSADKVQIIESGSVKFWYMLDIEVLWDTGATVDGAIIEVMDNHQTLIGVYTQTEADPVPTLMLNSFQFRETGLFTRSPYGLLASFKELDASTSVALDKSKSETMTLVDHAPPSIFINDPQSGHMQRLQTIQVRGSSYDSESDVDMVEVTIDGDNWYDTGSTTSWSYDFFVTEPEILAAAGTFTIMARAYDMAGNNKTTYVLVHVDPFEPTLLVEHPVNNQQTNEDHISVRGVTEMGASVTINGIEVQVAGTFFDQTVPLVEGKNTITVTASDALGNVVSKKLEVILDTKQPYIVLLTPVEDELFTGATCEVSGQAEDGLTIHVTHDGRSYELTNDTYEAGEFSYTLTLKRGENHVTVTAWDEAGNMRTIHRMVWLDDVMPVLAISQPEDGTYTKDYSINVIGTTDDDATLLINDETVTLDHGMFNYHMVGVEGENVITIVSMDTAGNTRTVELTVYVDTEAPTLDITWPATDRMIVNYATDALMGTAVGASEVLVNGVAYEVEDDEFYVEIWELKEGSNRFVIVAMDEAGNSVSMERVIIRDTTAPMLVVNVRGSTMEDGTWYYRTKPGEDNEMLITGYTDDAIQVFVNGEAVAMTEGGYFEYVYRIASVDGVNSLTVSAKDHAGNNVTWERTITHEVVKEASADEFEWGWMILAVGLILLIIMVLVGTIIVRRSAGTVEPMPEVEEDEVLAPAELPEVEEDIDEDLEEEPEDEEEDEDIEVEEDLEDEEEEEVFTVSAPARPKTDSRRPKPAAKEVPKPEEEEKDLSEKDADAEAGADETDQEGI